MPSTSGKQIYSTQISESVQNTFKNLDGEITILLPWTASKAVTWDGSFNASGQTVLEKETELIQETL